MSYLVEYYRDKRSAEDAAYRRCTEVRFDTIEQVIESLTDSQVWVISILDLNLNKGLIDNPFECKKGVDIYAEIFKTKSSLGKVLFGGFE